METTKNSWQSVDRIFSNIKRCYFSKYFFSKDSPEDHRYYHVTSFLGKPNAKIKRFYEVKSNLLRNTFVKITSSSRGKSS